MRLCALAPQLSLYISLAYREHSQTLHSYENTIAKRPGGHFVLNGVQNTFSFVLGSFQLQSFLHSIGFVPAKHKMAF